MNSYYKISIALLGMGLCGFQPTQISKQSPIRVGEPLVIVANFQSPSLAALKDNQSDFLNRPIVIPPPHKIKKTIPLVSGQASFMEPSEHLLERANTRYQMQLKKRRKFRRKLSGLVIDLDLFKRHLVHQGGVNKNKSSGKLRQVSKLASNKLASAGFTIQKNLSKGGFPERLHPKAFREIGDFELINSSRKR